MLHSKALWWSLLIVWIAGSTYWHICKILKLCDTELSVIVTDMVVPAVIEEPLIITDASAFKLHSSGNFAFAKGGIIANKSEVYPQMDSLAAYLSANPGKLLTITGLYAPDEVNTTIFSDLGIARASEIKNWLLGKGLADSMFSLKSRLKNDMVFSNDSLRGGIYFTFVNKIAASEIKLANEQKYESIFKPFDLYFPAAVSEYILTDQSQIFLEEAKKYFLKNENKKLILTVYSDDKDSTESNHALSEKRINSLKRKFISSGISADRLVTERRKLNPKTGNKPVMADRQSADRVTILVK